MINKRQAFDYMFINFELALIDVTCGRKQKDKIVLYQIREIQRGAGNTFGEEREYWN